MLTTIQVNHQDRQMVPKDQAPPVSTESRTPPKRTEKPLAVGSIDRFEGRPSTFSGRLILTRNRPFWVARTDRLEAGLTQRMYELGLKGQAKSHELGFGDLNLLSIVTEAQLELTLEAQPRDRVDQLITAARATGWQLRIDEPN